MIFRAFFFSLLLLFAGCSTMKVQSDYDPKFDFKQLRSFAVVYPENRSGKTLTQSRIAEALKARMVKKGYIPADKRSADFVMIFHTDVTSRQQIVTDYQMVGFYPMYGFGFGGAVTVPVQNEYTYDEAKIIIDAVDPDGNKIFWRAVATDELKTFDTPEERITYINHVVGEALKSFPNRQNIE